MATLQPHEEAWRGAFENLRGRFPHLSDDAIVKALRKNDGHAGRASIALRASEAPGRVQERRPPSQDEVKPHLASQEELKIPLRLPSGNARAPPPQSYRSLSEHSEMEANSKHNDAFRPATPRRQGIVHGGRKDQSWAEQLWFTCCIQREDH